MVFSEIPGLEGFESTFHAFPALQPLERRGEDENIHACAFAMAIGFTSLVLALHQEMEHRAAAGATPDRWEQVRADVLRRQVHELARAAVDDVARSLRLLPSLPHLAHVEWSNLQCWAQFVLAEADAGVTVTPARIKVFEMYAISLSFLCAEYSNAGYYQINRSAKVNWVLLGYSACVCTYSTHGGLCCAAPGPLVRRQLSPCTSISARQ